MMALLYETRKYHQEMAQLLGDRWRGEGRIVCNWDGTPMHHDTPSKQFRKFADAHGFEGVRFHDLRHTHATLLFANNIDAVAVASRLGHEDASTTLKVYAHAIRRRDRDSAEAMQRLIDIALGEQLGNTGEHPRTPED
jgi:integrase